MKLIYRGVTYDYNPPAVAYGDMSQTGTYRGVDVRFRNRQKPLVLPSTLKLIYRGHTYSPAQVAQATSAPQPKSPAKLIYRGNTYVVNPVVEQAAAVPAEPVAPVATATSINDRARQLMMNHHRDVKRRQQSMLTRLDARVGLPTSEASRFWNHIGGETHPAFSDSYDRSHAALS